MVMLMVFSLFGTIGAKDCQKAFFKNARNHAETGNKKTA